MGRNFFFTNEIVCGAGSVPLLSTFTVAPDFTVRFAGAKCTSSLTYLPALNTVPPLIVIVFFFAACAARANATEAAMAMPATMSRLVM